MWSAACRCLKSTASSTPSSPARSRSTPTVDVKTTFINSWFDPAAAKEAALAQIDAGADVLFAERFGVIEAAAENGLCSFGNMSDQKELAPESVVSGPVWNMQPTVDYIVNQVRAGAYTAQDLKDFSMVAKGGADPGAHQHGCDLRSGRGTGRSGQGQGRGDQERPLPRRHRRVASRRRRPQGSREQAGTEGKEGNGRIAGFVNPETVPHFPLRSPPFPLFPFSSPATTSSAHD